MRYLVQNKGIYLHLWLRHRVAALYLNKEISPGKEEGGDEGRGLGQEAGLLRPRLMRWFGYRIQTPTCHCTHTSRGAEVFIGDSDHLGVRGTFRLGMGPLGSWQNFGDWVQARQDGRASPWWLVENEH